MPLLDDFGGGGLLRGGVLGGQLLGGRPGADPLDPEEKRSFGGELLARSQGALGGLLHALSTPGDYTRGVLAGRPGERVTGPKLLEHWGVTAPGDQSWGAWGLGLGADIVTDPLTYASFGTKHALTGAGRELYKAGHLQGWSRKQLARGFEGVESAMGAQAASRHRALGKMVATPAQEADFLARTGRALVPGERLTGLARFSVPFKPEWGFTLGGGRTAEAVGALQDKAADFLQFGNPIGRGLGALFDWRRRGAVHAPEQRAFVAAQPLTRSIEAAGYGQHYRTTAALDEIGRDLEARGLAGHGVNIKRAFNINVEGTSPLPFLEGARDPAERALLEDLLRRTKGPADELAGTHYAAELARSKAEGAPRRGLGDEFARFGPRQSTKAMLRRAGPQVERGPITPVVSGSNRKRLAFLRDLPGGTDRINDWAHRFAGHGDRAAVASEILDDTIRDYEHIRGPLVDPDRIAAFGQQADKLSAWLSKLAPETYLGKIAEHPYFTHDAGANLLRYTAQQQKTVTGARVGVRSLAARALPPGALPAGVEGVPLTKAMNRLKLRTYEGPAGDVIGAAPELHRALAPRGAADTAAVLAAGGRPGLEAELAGWMVPRHSLDELARDVGRWVAPEEAIRPIKAIDSITNAFKSLVYPLWPASHVRNLGSAYLNALRTGTKFGDIGAQYGMMRGLEPAAAAHAAREAQYAHAGVMREAGPTLELAGGAAPGPAAAQARRGLEYTPGTTAFGMGRIGPAGNLAGDVAHLVGKEGLLDLPLGVYRKLRDWKGAPNPFQMAGVAEKQLGGRFVRHEDVLAPLVAGRKVGGNIEELMRGGQFRGLTRQGYSPEMAGELVRKYQFSYSDLTPFEKKWMRRIAPFYTYTRKNLPLQLETLATRPGAFAAPFKPMTAAQEVYGTKDQYVPEHLATGFAMPLSPEVGGQQRYLTSLGLPQEEAFKEFAFKGGLPDVTRTMMGLAGNLNPILKGALEQISGHQFYSGRKLSELRPTAAGRGLASLFSDEYAQPYDPTAQYLTQFVANTPLSRFATTLDKLADTKALYGGGRKPLWMTAANLFTGGRVSDVDLGRSRYFDQVHALQSLLGAQPHLAPFESYYARPDQRELVTPQERIGLQMQQALGAQGREFVARRRQQQGG